MIQSAHSKCSSSNDNYFHGFRYDGIDLHGKIFYASLNRKENIREQANRYHYTVVKLKQITSIERN